jgi:hypothetical protein
MSRLFGFKNIKKYLYIKMPLTSPPSHSRFILKTAHLLRIFNSPPLFRNTCTRRPNRENQGPEKGLTHTSAHGQVLVDISFGPFWRRKKLLQI